LPDERTIIATIHVRRGAVLRVVDSNTRRNEMTLGTILLIAVILILLGVIPRWSHSRSWGYMPSGVVGLVAVVLVVMLATGHL
jgi:Protein of unknown function (DUF3309)